MVGMCLVPLMTLALAVAPDAASLVARLGSGTVAEREEAAGRLEAMGGDALPALVAALRSPDAEVRSRVLEVWGRVQKRLMVRPSMVRFEGGQRPLHEVVRSMGRQCGFSLELYEQGPARALNAREPVTIPFWEAVERLGLGGRFTITNPGGGHFPTLGFSPGRESGCPSMTSGPFRITLEGLHEHRDRLFIDGLRGGVEDRRSKASISRKAQEQQARFYIELGLMVEPRMWFTQEGPARVIEAVDDLGQSLLRRDPGRVEGDFSMFHNGGGVTEGQTQLDLAMPEKPGRSIVRLRGTIPVALHMREPRPALELDLPAREGQAFAHEDGEFRIRSFREDAQGTWIDVDVRINLDRFELPADHRGEIVTSRLGCLASHQVDVVDADGHVLADGGGGSHQPDGTARMSLVVWKNLHKTRPARLRYYRMVRAFMDVTFAFQDIPMP